MDTNEHKIIAGLMHMVIEADKFHLSVAKRLLAPSPISERERSDLLDLLSKREHLHEQMEASVSQMIKHLNGK